MDKILCCDWGTSSFRLRLVNLNADVIGETQSDKGILFFYNNWLNQNDDNLTNRFNYYLEYIQSQMSEIIQDVNIDLKKLPLVISGMAVSSIGMINIPYEKLPFILNATSGFECKFQKNGAPIILITGVCSEDDLMRGEETQMVGLYHTPELNSILPEKGIFILPGTHSKHISVHNKTILSIRTFLTGELFKILTENGTLSKSIQFISHENNINSENQSVFKKGIHESKNSSLLHSLFKVRVNDILKKLNKEQNYYYLSGLLIGSEFNYILSENSMQNKNKLVICCNYFFTNYYKTVLIELGLLEQAIFIDPSLFEKATVIGQIIAYKKYYQLK